MQLFTYFRKSFHKLNVVNKYNKKLQRKNLTTFDGRANPIQTKDFLIKNNIKVCVLLF